MTPQFREPVVSDAPRIAELSGELGYPVAAPVVAERLGRILGRADHFVMAVDLPDAGIVAWIHAAEEETLESPRRCEIRGLVVGTGFRKQGLGRQLIQRAEAWAASRDLGEIGVHSNIVRAESHPFYESVDFKRTKTQHVYRKTLV